MLSFASFSRSRSLGLLAVAALTIAMPGCGPALVEGENVQNANPEGVLHERVGLASYYGAEFEGQETASGEIFDKEEMVAAHPSYPVGTVVRVTNLANGKNVQLRIIDRGPTAENRQEGVIIDVSKGAALSLGFVRKGRTKVKVEVLRWGAGKN